MVYNDAEVLKAGMGLVPDYAAQVQQKLLSDLTRAQIASTQSEQQIAGAKFSYERQRQQDYLAAVSELGRNPTFEGYQDIQARFPEHHEALSKAAKEWKTNEGDKSLDLFSEILGAGRNGRWDLAARTAEKWMEADRKRQVLNPDAGPGQSRVVDAGDDPADAEILRILQSGTDIEREQVLGMITHKLGSVVGRDHAAAMWNSVMDDDRARKKLPGEVRKIEADATTSEAEAENAAEYFDGRAREQTADADISENNSAWQEAKNALAVAKGGAQLANVRSLIAKRAAALGKPIGEVTTGDMRRHYTKKRERGAKLSPAEITAEPVFAPKPKPAPKAAPTIVNPQTGERMILRDGKWVKL